jgi:hypothetical protein
MLYLLVNHVLGGEIKGVKDTGKLHPYYSSLCYLWLESCCCCDSIASR